VCVCVCVSLKIDACLFSFSIAMQRRQNREKTCQQEIDFLAAFRSSIRSFIFEISAKHFRSVASSATNVLHAGDVIQRSISTEILTFANRRRRRHWCATSGSAPFRSGFCGMTTYRLVTVFNGLIVWLFDVRFSQTLLNEDIEGRATEVKRFIVRRCNVCRCAFAN
jgi:hypothetical protein